MLKKSKSSYFTQRIFSLIGEKRKLQLLKYNKNLQKLMNIGIINYRYYKGNGILYDFNGMGKEYNVKNNRVEYEGEYINGERNGKGKEYDILDRLIFEGEYVNGKRNGKGREYNENGEILFQGEYLNNTRWIGTLYKYNIFGERRNYKLNNNINGKVKEYYNSGKLQFKGEYLNGQRNGKGREYNKEGYLIFEGEYLNDLKQIGYVHDPFNNIIYELKDGKGFVRECDNINNELIFEGEYLHGQRNGKGKEYNDEGELIFEGEFLNGQRNGKGVEYDEEGFIKFKGEYINGKKNGKGLFYSENGFIFEGEYLYDFKIKGKLLYNINLEYEGEFFYNKKWTGKGYDEKGNIIYELINGTGKIKEYDEDEDGFLIYEGEYLNGEKHGRGKE